MSIKEVEKYIKKRIKQNKEAYKNSGKIRKGYCLIDIGICEELLEKIKRKT